MYGCAKTVTLSGLEYLTQDHGTTKRVGGYGNTATEKERAYMLKTLCVELYWLIRVLLTPTCWLRLGRYSKEWDRQLRVNMVFFKFEHHKYSIHQVQLGEYEVWISNHPYASFKMVKHHTPLLGMLPSRRTVLKARKKLLEDMPSAFECR